MKSPALAISLLSLLAPAYAQDAKSPAIKIETPWLRATPKGAPVIGGYVTVTNTGPAADRIVGASIPVAARAEVHTMTMKDGVMHMERLEDGLAVAPGATVTLEPGGNHLMFFKPTAQIKEGQSIKGTIILEKAGAVPVTFAVGAIGAKLPPGAKSPPGAKAMPSSMTMPSSKAMPGMPGMKMQ